MQHAAPPRTHASDMWTLYHGSLQQCRRYYFHEDVRRASQLPMPTSRHWACIDGQQQGARRTGQKRPLGADVNSSRPASPRERSAVSHQDAMRADGEIRCLPIARHMV